MIDSQPLLADCLAAALDRESCYSVVLRARSAEEAFAALDRQHPDVLLIDFGLADRGAERLVGWAMEQQPAVRTVILGSERAPESEVLTLLGAGARAFLRKESTFEALRSSLDSVLRDDSGEALVLDRRFVSRLQREGSGERPADGVLTRRELEVLELVSEGLSNKEIAKRLCISLYTVKNHVHNVLEKLQVTGRYAAVAQAYERQWLQPRWG
ncbi:MAG: response regulator transcription factor [Acidobacteriota bacterium]